MANWQTWPWACRNLSATNGLQRQSSLPGVATNLATWQTWPWSAVKPRQDGQCPSWISPPMCMCLAGGRAPHQCGREPPPPTSKSVANWQTQFFFGRNQHRRVRLRRQMSLPTLANSVANWQTQWPSWSARRTMTHRGGRTFFSSLRLAGGLWPTADKAISECRRRVKKCPSFCPHPLG